MVKKTELKKLLIFFLTWRVALFLVGALAPLFLFYDASFPYSETLLPLYGLPQWLYSWANFDGVHYLTIAEKGYIGTGLVQAFFPGYPFLINFINLALNNTLVVGLLISNIFSLVLTLLWFYFLKDLFDKKTAWIGTLILFLFPTSFFFGAIYNESFFLSLVLGSFIAVRKNRWWLAGIMVAIATATRVVGVLLVPALLIELASQKNFDYKRVGEYWKKALPIILGTSTLLFYMRFLYGEFRDALYFLHVQSEFGGGRQESLVLYPQVVWRYIKILLTYRPINLKYFSFIQEFMVGLSGLAVLIYSYRKIRLSYLVYGLSVFLLPTLTGTFSSMPRYLLVVFPFFIILAKFFRSRKRALIIWLSLSTILLIFNTILFIQGYWVA